MSGKDMLSIVIFGASGDLTWRKLVPAFFNNACKNRLPENFNIVGVSRTNFTHDEFRSRIRQGIEDLTDIPCSRKDWSQFAGRIWYQQGDAGMDADYAELDAFLKELENSGANRLYYLATAPSLFPLIIEHLGRAGMAAADEGWRRIVVEKPFGRDLRSAVALNETVHRVFQEDQVYRIDHYLGKETAQNILYFRFLNSIFEPVWNRNHIDHVQITVAESVDVEHRADYYDQAGVVRDMFQNHLLQLLSLVAMEPPAKFSADAIRNEKVKVLSAVRAIDLADAVRAQYEGYRGTKGVVEGSQTPTYAQLKLFIDNWRWQNVPFYLRSGKGLLRKTSEIMIEFKPPPHVMFPLPEDYHLTPNIISLCIQPDEGIHLRFETKIPDSHLETRSVEMEFHYGSSFEGGRMPDAYERLLMDAIAGDASLFTRSDEIETAWRIIDPVIVGWSGADALPALVEYVRGSWGPLEAQKALEKDGRKWRLGCEN
jgi:glucose-6-phosphate 1-dehydrogenase